MKKLCCVLMITLCFLSFVSAQDTYDSWIPFMYDGVDNWNSFVYVVNPSESQASIVLTAYESNGEEIKSISFNLSSLNSTVFPFDTYYFGNSLPENGKISFRLQSDTSLVKMTGVYISSSTELENDFILVPASPADMKSYILPQVINNDEYDTYLGVVNTESGSVSPTFELWTEGGNQAVNQANTISSYSQLFGLMSDFVPGYRGEGWMKISHSQHSFAGTVFYQNEEFDRKSWSAVPMLYQQQDEYSLPLGLYMIGNWRTQVYVVNTNNDYVSFSMKAWKTDGSQTGIEKTYSVNPNGRRLIEIDDNTFSRNLSDNELYSLTMTPQGSGLYFMVFYTTYREANRDDIVPVIPPANNISEWTVPIVIDSDVYSTYVTLKNPSSASGNYRLTCYSETGGVIGYLDLTLNSQEMTIGSVADFIPQMEGRTGWMKVDSLTENRTVSLQVLYFNNTEDRNTVANYTPEY